MDNQYTLKEFGALIKSKSPAYSSYSDEEIANKMLEKYPIYQSKIINNTNSNNESSGFIDRAVGGVVNTLKNISGSVYDTIANRNKELSDTNQLVNSGQLNPAVGYLRGATQGMGIINDLTNKAVEGVINSDAGKFATQATKDQFPQFSVPTEIASSVFRQSGLSDIAKNELGNIAQKYQDWEANNPNQATTLKSIFDLGQFLATLYGGTEAVKTGVPVAKEAINSLPSVIENASSKIGGIASNVGGKINLSRSIDPLEVAIKDATPTYGALSTSQKGKVLNRVQEGGILGERTVKPTKLEVEAGTELSKIPGYDPSATKLAKYQLAQNEIAKRGQELETKLDAEKIIVPKKQVVNIVKNAIADTTKDSLLIQRADPAVKNYVRVLENAVNQSDGTLGGILRLRKTLDSVYENARGKLAFGSDKLSALDEIHTSSRNALTQYLVDNAKTDVKSALRSQWNLYRASDELKFMAEKEAGSIIGRLMQQYPRSTKAVKMVGKAAGLGKAVEMGI